MVKWSTPFRNKSSTPTTKDRNVLGCKTCLDKDYPRQLKCWRNTSTGNAVLLTLYLSKQSLLMCLLDKEITNTVRILDWSSFLPPTPVKRGLRHLCKTFLFNFSFTHSKHQALIKIRSTHCQLQVKLPGAQKMFNKAWDFMLERSI